MQYEYTEKDKRNSETTDSVVEYFQKLWKKTGKPKKAIFFYEYI